MARIHSVSRNSRSVLDCGSPVSYTHLDVYKRQTQGRSRFHSDLDDYARLTTLELETTARLVKALYATMNRFDAFKELSLLYFAAASFSEAARRLGKTRLSQDFLFCRHPVFAPQLRQLCESSSRNLEKRVRHRCV